MPESPRFFTYIPLRRDIVLTHLISLFYQKFPRNFYFGGEAHDFWELVYIDKGQLLVTAGEKQYLLKAGEMAFHKPSEFHALRAFGEVAANVIIASFVCVNPCMRYFEHRFISLAAQEREFLYEALQHSEVILDNGFASKTPAQAPFGDMQIVQANLELLLIRLIRRGESAKIQTRIETYIQMTHTRQTAEQVDAYLEAHLPENLTLSRIAADLGYSVSQMKKLYRRQTGRGIIDTFIGLKMDEARRRLREGRLNISQTAAALGYDNAAYFSRLFRQRFDMTPSECARSFALEDGREKDPNEFSRKNLLSI